jgi:hypothetical protein
MAMSSPRGARWPEMTGDAKFCGYSFLLRMLMASGSVKVATFGFKPRIEPGDFHRALKP